MSNQISSQATKVWQIISAPDTATTYQQALSVTWTILREAAILVWLVLCLVLVAFDWFWTNSIYAGRRARLWVESFDQQDTNQMASEAGKALVTTSKNSLAFAISQARERLGLPEKQEPVLPVVEKRPEPVAPVTAPTPTATPAPTVEEPLRAEQSVPRPTTPSPATSAPPEDTSSTKQPADDEDFV